jgi:hypothetical protein
MVSTGFVYFLNRIRGCPLKKGRMLLEVRHLGDIYTTSIVHIPYLFYTSSNQNKTKTTIQKISQLFSRAQLPISMLCSYDRGVPRRLEGVLSRDKTSQGVDERKNPHSCFILSTAGYEITC